MLIDENGQVNPALINLARIRGLDVRDDISPKVLNTLLQERWVMTWDGAMRFQIGGSLPTKGEMALLKKLGATDSICINFDTRYAGTLILGATLKAVVRRMWFALSEERSDEVGIIPQPVYLLGSRRPLDPKLEMPANVPAILEETGATFTDEWKHCASAPAFWPPMWKTKSIFDNKTA
jgi:hypothetical protein